MKSSLVISILGDDRPGLVRLLSETMVKHNANWTDSKMANMLGKFAGILQVSVDAEHIAALTHDLKALHNADNHLQVLVESADNSDNTEALGEVFVIGLLGQDRVGIIDEITRVLASLNVNVDEMSTEQREASMSGEVLFFAQLELRAPVDMQVSQVQEALEDISDQLMVDITFG